MFKQQLDYRFKYGGITLLLVLSIILYVFEFKWFNKAINIQNLIISSLILGVFIGILLGFIFKKSGEDLTERIQIFIFFIILSVLFSPLAASLANRLLSLSTKTEKVEIYDIKGRLSKSYGLIKGESTKPNQFIIFYIRHGELFEFKTSNEAYLNLKKGDFLDMKFKQGLLGFEVLE